MSVVGLLALVSPLSSAAQGDTPSAERALLGKTNAPFGVSAGNAPRILDGTRALLGREAEGNAPVVQAGQAIRQISLHVSAVDGLRALLGRSTWAEGGRPGRSAAKN